jgi:hypothetical protein
MKTRKQALQDEFNDLEEEFCFCGSRDERRRCSSRMQAILAELSTLTPTQHRPHDEEPSRKQ